MKNYSELVREVELDLEEFGVEPGEELKRATGYAIMGRTLPLTHALKKAAESDGDSYPVGQLARLARDLIAILDGLPGHGPCGLAR
ncbi:hypothetical protein GTE7_gp083 [Gordonia phage GTE7]|uniref:Uncharacterized protein n=1 Tax=Gordonia phage GTE7 TaxID=1100814 RepID=G8FS76_9CAUD|nr:hypothetical protein GTE7_gp083 [Gordonia phage GTE7]AER26626.1 hypothetical protein [Gordonia phage GTE7]